MTLLLGQFMQRVHFIGIGGAGMSAIAELLHRLGVQVSGSDASDSAVLQRLRSLGIRAEAGHDAAHLNPEQQGMAHVVVVSTAVAADNVEVRAAQALGLPVVHRAQMLAELMRGRLAVAVAGTHGKTTTTALVTTVLMASGAQPSYVLGGELLATGANAGLGQGSAIVVEADESDASFLHLLPVLAVVTNIDEDHMATYGHSRQQLDDAFVNFLHRLPFYGTAIVCSDDPGVCAVLPRVQRPVLRYGLGAEAALRAVDVQAGPGAQMRFVACQAGHADLPVVLKLAGEHNVRNALAAIAVARLLKQADVAVQQALAGFGGAGRRFQNCGGLPARSGGSFTVIDDYGHHPVELAAVLAAARAAYPGQRLLAVFQPHRYSRTRDCMASFAAVLAQFDAVLLAPVYAAGEAPLTDADSATLAAQVPGAQLVAELADLPAAVLDTARDGDIVLTLGAGSIASVPSAVRALSQAPTPQQGALA